MLDQPVPNPVAKNPNIHTHKVFASVGLILIGTIIAVAGIWWYVDNQSGDNTAEESTITTKISTSSASKTTETESKDETAEWKTYTNSTYMFSFKYPTDWEVIEQPISNSNSTVAYFGIRPTNLKEDNAQGVTIFTSSLEDTKTYYTKIIYINSNYLGESPSSLGGLDATKLSFQNKADSAVKPTINLVEKGAYTYSISGCCSGPSPDVEAATEKIITTFKFL